MRKPGDPPLTFSEEVVERFARAWASIDGRLAEFDRERWDNCMVKPDCVDPQVTEWPVSDVYTAVTKEFADKAGVAMDYVKTRAWSNETVNAMLAWMVENQASNEDAAYEFLERHEEIWTRWVPAEVADKVKAAL